MVQNNLSLRRMDKTPTTTKRPPSVFPVPWRQSSGGIEHAEKDAEGDTATLADMSWRDNAIAKARMFLENDFALVLALQEAGQGISPRQATDLAIGKLVEIAETSFPLARVMDQSDIVFHAEGPGASRTMPRLSAFNWMAHTVNTTLKVLSTAVFDVLGSDGKKLARNLDFRVPGIAHASLWMGVKLMPAEADLLSHDGELFNTLLDGISSLPNISRFIDDEGLRPGLDEAQPDPAMRDVQLSALYKFSPTGRMGIHTMQMQTRAHGAVSLGQRERVVLREALVHPDTRKTTVGNFDGEVRDADLDKTRMHLRGVKDVGTLRCIIPGMEADHVSKIIGRTVRVHGRYQSDKQGRPRLMFVERIEHLPGTASLL